MRSRPSLVFALLVPILCAACEAELSSGLAEDQADEIVLALDAAGIGARKAREAGGSNDARYRVTVGSEELTGALAVLHEAGLPRHHEPGFAELFGEPGLVPSVAEERARYASAVAGELARSLESMDGVGRARVHVATPEATGALDDAPPRARASVLISHPAGSSVDEAAVRRLVAGAVDGLAPEDVAVVLSRAPSPTRREPRLAQVGPFAVSRGSAPALKAALAVAFALNLMLAAALVWSRRRAWRNEDHGAPARGRTADTNES
jgi:type III secretion system YscJ/HrcJ family lipoprotein